MLANALLKGNNRTSFMNVTTDITEMVTEQIEYRELLLQMTRRDLLLRY